jgi:hypothetical protein
VRSCRGGLGRRGGVQYAIGGLRNVPIHRRGRMTTNSRSPSDYRDPWARASEGDRHGEADRSVVRVSAGSTVSGSVALT